MDIPMIFELHYTTPIPTTNNPTQVIVTDTLSNSDIPRESDMRDRVFLENTSVITFTPIPTNTPAPIPTSNYLRGSGFTANGCAGNNPTCGVRVTPTSTNTQVEQTITPISTATNTPTQVPEQTVTNTPEPTAIIDYNQMVTVEGHAKINDMPQDTPVEQDKGIIEKSKALFTAWCQWVEKAPLFG